MKKQKSKGVFWWVLLGIILAALLGYVLKKELAQNHMVPSPKSAQEVKQQEALSAPPSEPTLPSNSTEKRGLPSPTAALPETGVPSPRVKQKGDYCAQLENDLKDFFSYLDRRPYVQHLELGKPLVRYAREMIRQLSAHPPVPAGEGIDPRILTRNIYHLYRVLGLKAIRLVREVLRNQQDSIEINLDILYRWVMAGDRCPDHLGLRPSFGVLYKYAGFFVNTIGGRACLSRRSNRTRILATYYCLLILHEADRRGLNNYGIDVYPLIVATKNEITHYHDLEFQPEYLAKLTKMENYYMEKR